MVRQDTNSEVTFDVTPMIDIVFLLIIFFMVITDLSQRELEELTLPAARNAELDRPATIRPVINVSAAGAVAVLGRTLVEAPTPRATPDFTEFERWLAITARSLPIEQGPTGPIVSSCVLIRSDETAPFEVVQRIMELCAREDVPIRYVELATSLETERTHR